MNELSVEICRPIEAHARAAASWQDDAFVANWFSDPRLCPLFVLHEGRRVGLLRFRRRREGPDDGCELLVARSPEVQAGAVLELAAEHLRAAGIDVAWSDVKDDEVADFEAAGWTRSGRTMRMQLRQALPGSNRVFVIAEAGSNWRMGTRARDLQMGRTLIDVAAEAGADAVKFQTYRADTVYVENAGTSDYLEGNGIKEDIRAIFEDLSMPYDYLAELAAHCERAGILFMSTPFSAADFAAVDPFVSVHKVASYEISHPTLISLAARSGKPLVMSTGASVEDDIAWAVDLFRREGGRVLCLLQCTACYPAPADSLELRTISWLAARFGVHAGLSDHSRHPLHAPLAAVALGARVIEKHFTIHNRLPGPDHAFAVLPHELKQMVEGIRGVEQALGEDIKRVGDVEQELAAYARRGLQASRHIQKGERLVPGSNLEILRPGRQPLGLHPRHLDRVVGRAARHDIPVGCGLREGDWLES